MDNIIGSRPQAGTVCPFSLTAVPQVVNPKINQVMFQPWAGQCIKEMCKLWLGNECAIVIIAKTFVKEPTNGSN